MGARVVLERVQSAPLRVRLRKVLWHLPGAAPRGPSGREAVLFHLQAAPDVGRPSRNGERMTDGKGRRRFLKTLSATGAAAALGEALGVLAAEKGNVTPAMARQAGWLAS